ncbi:putative transmembrane protein [Coleophoma crateriformis]|uniref:Putative transmembrane protein n=1 Tax=Coleophoma crateriformis TaxID=565419 RepID=A0A3D8RJF6_9HELO|nr:putative transmembrane protein [Coleophoma crateriformis]
MSASSQAHELKAQGVIEAANDPDSSVTAEDAQHKIVQESQKAGVAAFEFDPDASPEQKAAQARARVPDGFHHEHKSKGVALATDIDDGAPGAYDLPEPTTAGALAPTGPPKDQAGQPLTNGVSGAFLDEDEDARWIERAGWAPRFGNGMKGDEDEGETLLDHQTWLEGKLEDKYYGDWYHNTAVIIFACLSSWLVAVLGGGLGWVFLIMAICGTYYRTSIRRVRRNFRDDVNRELAKNKLETDTESLEWINSFLVKFWPIFQPVLAETIINSVDQVLSTATPAFLDSLRMKTFTLGTKPPRMEHVKTYPKADDDVVLMDWKFSFTPNDHADMTARQIKNKVNPKIVLEIRIGKAMISKGLDVIVEDMTFSGLMRVKVKLQIPFPHVEKIEICFLERPYIDYVCKPLGGETLGFDINFIPGLESFILEQIHANLGPMMYEPNVFPIEVAKMLSGSAVDQAIGVVAVTLHGAQGLKNPDKFAGTPDPYTVLALNNGAALAQTKIIKENANPKWNETKYVIITSFNDSLTMQIFDYNEYRKDKELGTATFPLERIQEVREYENERLEVMANGKPRGVLSTDIRFFPILEGEDLGEGKKGPPPESNTGIARFTVEQAKDLDGTKSLIGQLNPYAVLLLNNKEIHVTKKLKRTNNPIWDNGSKEILITDRKTAKFGLVIKDDRDLSADPILGTYQIKLDDMLNLMEKGQEWYNLAGAKTGRAKLTLQWKPIALSGVGAGNGGYVTPVGVMRVHFKSARDLRNLETLGKSDAYGRVLLSGIEKGRTVTFKNNLNPDWDEIVYVPVHSTREKLALEVMDQETMGNDRSLGLIEISASDYVKQAENGEYLVHDSKALVAGSLRMHGKGSPKGTLNYSVSFYPCLNIADPEDEEDEAKKSIETSRSSSSASSGIAAENAKAAGKFDPTLAKTLAEGEKEQEETSEAKALPKIRLTPEELVKYESGLIIFKLLDADLVENDVHVEVMVDDMAFPSYSSSLIKSRKTVIDEIGDCFVRELDFSKLTLRIREKGASTGEEKKDKTIARLTGNTLDTLKQCLNNPTTLKLKGDDGRVSSVKVSLKYIPVKMQLDPSESINNMGKLRVDVLDASDLPSADRNGYSDPFCEFELNGQKVFKTKVQKKTLHPAWNEFFEVDIPSRTAAQFTCRVNDWDFGEKADFLGAADINLELLEPFKAQEFNLGLDGKSGSLRLRLLFRPDYVTRSRQGSSTFSGTFAAPGKIVTGVAGAPIKGVGLAAQSVGKGASFIRRGFTGKKKDEPNGVFLEEADTTPNGDSGIGGLRRATGLSPAAALSDPVTPPGSSHQRTKSFGAASMHSNAGTSPGPASTGTANFTIVSATGYPPSSSILVYVKQLGSKTKVIHKTKHIKSPSGVVTFDESFKCSCSADTQFQIQVKAHATFGSDDDLGEALFFVDESGSGEEKSVKAGSGTVVVKSNFVLASTNGPGESPRGGVASGSFRKSMLSKNGRASREITPA